MQLSQTGPAALAARFDLARHARAVPRIAALLALSLGAGFLCVAARAIEGASPRLGRSVHGFATRGWARAVARTIGLRVRVEGAPPPGPRLLVANHLSYVDVIALWVACDGHFVAKSEVASWPLVGALGRVARTLFVDRGRKRDLLRVLPAMQRLLEGGASVTFFPEGTSTSGDRVLPFKSPLFEAAVRAGVPVACASLRYETPADAPPAALAVCWWGDMTFGDHVYRLLGLPGFEATVRFVAEPLRGADRKALARAAHARVAASFARGAAAPGDVARLAHECAELLAQAADVVRAIGEDELVRPGPGASASAGAHLRHCVELFDCFAAGVALGAIDYDQRPRDARLERDAAAALARIESLRTQLRDTVARRADAPLRVRADESELPPGEGFAASSIARELRALASHTVHHYAVIALLLRSRGIAVAPRFGVAPSTWAHWERTGVTG